MVDRIECTIEESESLVKVRVTVNPRIVKNENPTSVDTEDVKKILLDKGVEFDIMVSKPITVISNFNKGSLSSGEWVFKRKKVQSAKPRQKQTRNTTRNTTKKTKD